MWHASTVAWRRRPFRSRKHHVDWAEDMLRRRRRDQRRALELIVDASVRHGWQLAHDVRDAELRQALRIGVERDPGGMEPWEPPAPSQGPARDIIAAAAMLAEQVDVTGDGGDRES